MFGEYSDTRAHMEPDGQVVEEAHAKVNLLLLVGPRRTDGYHPVATVLQTLALHDVVRLEWRGVRAAGETPDSAGFRAGGFGRIEVDSSDASLPRGEGNLAYRAAKAVERVLVDRGLFVERLRIHISKRIPAAAGLAGGSADAAAVLRALDRGLGLGIAPAELRAIGAGLGADVPACVLSGAVYGRGRGDEVIPVAAHTTWWVLLNPGIPLGAGEVYAALDAHFSDTLRSEDLTAPLETLAPGLGEALAAGRTKDLGRLLHNDLQAPALLLRPDLQRLIDAAISRGAVVALVSGSGPTIAALAESSEDARRLAQELVDEAPWVWWGPAYFPAGGTAGTEATTPS